VPLWERTFVVVVFVTACRAFVSLPGLFAGNHSGASEMGDSSPARFAWLTILYGVGLVLLVAHHHREILKLVSQNKLLVLVIAYILLSTTWAFDPNASLRRAAAFGLTAVFCAYLALRYSPLDILKLAGWGLLVVAVLSLVSAVLFPEFGLEPFGRKMGWWKGICGINTAFGRFMALGILVIWCLRRADWRLQRFDVLVFGLFLLCTYHAHAASSLAAVFGAFCSILAIWSRSVFNIELAPKVLIGTLVGLVLLATVPFYLGDVLLLLSRDETLTNRVFIWRAAFEQGWHNPIFGVGYSSFWIEGNAASAFHNMFGSANTEVGNGHNGYLDVWLELGFVGLGLLLLLMAQALTRVIRYLTVSGEPFAEFYGGLLVFIVIYSIAEKVIFVHSEFTWMMFMTGLMVLRWRHGMATHKENARPEWDGALPNISRRAP